MLGFRRPAAGFAHIGEGERAGVRYLLGEFLEQRRLLRTRNREGRAGARGRMEAIGLGAAEMAHGLHARTRTTAADRFGIQRHRVFARANDNGTIRRHSWSNVPRRNPPLASARSRYNDCKVKFDHSETR
jgi:hypothetical protein